MLKTRSVAALMSLLVLAGCGKSAGLDRAAPRALRRSDLAGRVEFNCPAGWSWSGLWQEGSLIFLRGNDQLGKPSLAIEVAELPGYLDGVDVLNYFTEAVKAKGGTIEHTARGHAADVSWIKIRYREEGRPSGLDVYVARDSRFFARVTGRGLDQQGFRVLDSIRIKVSQPPEPALPESSVDWRACESD